MTEHGRVHLEHAEVIGERVHLRPVSLGDAQACYDLVHEAEEITDWIQWDGPESVEEVEQHYSSWSISTEEMVSYTFAIMDRGSGAWAGSIAVRHLMGPPAASIGYLVGAPFQGRGLGSEAVRLIVELAFRELAVLLVHAEVFLGNHPSIRVLERAGLRLDRGQRTSCENGGQIIEKDVYSISRVAWEMSPASEHVWTTRLFPGE